MNRPFRECVGTGQIHLKTKLSWENINIYIGFQPLQNHGTTSSANRTRDRATRTTMTQQVNRDTNAATTSSSLPPLLLDNRNGKCASSDMDISSSDGEGVGDDNIGRGTREGTTMLSLQMILVRTILVLNCRQFLHIFHTLAEQQTKSSPYLRHSSVQYLCHKP